MTDHDSPDSYDLSAQWTTKPSRNLITLTCSSKEPAEAQEFMDRLKPVIDANIHEQQQSVPVHELRQLIDEWRFRTDDTIANECADDLENLVKQHE